MYRAPVARALGIIFVRPLDIRTMLNCPFPLTDALRKLTLYSAKVDMEYIVTCLL
jgi:hypothetical protein